MILGAGGGLNLAVGETYFIELTTQTATAYEQLQSFLTLSNTIFQVKSVSTTYSTLTAPPSRAPVPNPSLYADGCLWDPDLNSPNYNSCLATGKAGGLVVTTYEIDIIAGGGDSIGLLALIYDLSGGSFHYNTDFSQSPGDINVIDPSASGFSKRFLPATISPDGVSRLQFTMTNPNPIALAGYNFIDNLPAGVEVANPPNGSSSCGGIWNPLPGDTTLAFNDGIIGANGSCTVLVDVTAALEGEYDNISENLFIGVEDTGNNAVATLTVNDGPLPPACVPGTELARWTMDPSQGTATPPLPFEVHLDVGLAAASFTGSALPGVQSIGTTFGNSVNAWQGTGWSTATTPFATGPGPNDASYFEFELDTSAFSTNPAEPLDISIDVNPAPTGNWANPSNLTVNVHASVDGGPFSTIINANPIERQAWTTLTGQAPAGVGTTRFRVNITGRNNENPDATFSIDNIIFTGCGPGAVGAAVDPPTLSKTFDPEIIAAGEVSSLVFEIVNPNPADALSGVSFEDELPFGMTVANPASAFSNCGGTWAPAPGDGLLQFSGGSVAAGGSCTLGVDVTSSVLGTSVNISDFIFANESGQNAGPGGSASASLVVLAPPSISKAFDPNLLLLGTNQPDVALLSFVISNPNLFDPISGVAFEDVLPVDLVVAEPASGPAELSVVKQLLGQSDNPVVLGTLLNYQIIATNTDPILMLTDVTVEDSLVAVDLVDDCTWPGLVGVLEPTESVTCVVDYAVTQPDLDAGSVINQASATAAETGTTEARYRLFTPIVDSGCGTPAFNPLAGDTVLDFSNGTIAAGGSCTVSVWVTGPAGVYNNLSSPVSQIVSGVVAEGNSVEDDLVIDQPIPGISILKQVGASDDPEGAWANYLAIEAGEPVFYRLSIENIGETPLSNFTVVDALDDTSACAWNAPGFELPIADVGDPLAHIAVCIVGPVIAVEGVTVNVAFASAEGAGLTVEDDDSATYATSELTLVKTADPEFFEEAGDIINYEFLVTNTGAAILAGPVQIYDPLIGSVLCPDLTTIGNNDNFFDPSEFMVCTGSYTIDADDVTAGFVTNVAFAFTPEAVSNNDDATVELANPLLVTFKSYLGADTDPGPVGLGSLLGYELTVSNTGNVTLTGVVVSDSLVAVDQVNNCTWPNGVGTLLPNEVVTCTVSYTVTQDDVDAGGVVNVATGDSTESPPVDSPPVVVPVPSADLELVKTLITDGPYLVGQTVVFEIVVTNHGPSDATNIEVTDTPTNMADLTVIDAGGADCPGDQFPCTLAGLAVDDSFTIVVQAELVDVGPFVNEATVTATEPDPVPDNNTDSDGSVVGVGDPDPVVTVVKSADPASGETVVAGQTITYTLTVTVADGATTTDVVLVDTLGAGLTVDTLPAGCAAVGQEITCTLTSGAVPDVYTFVYTATVDADASMSVGNSVVIDGDGGDPTPTCPSCTTNHPVNDPNVNVRKNADPISGSEVTPGQTIAYTLIVEVIDSATTDAVVLTDTLGAGLTLDVGSLPTECSAQGQVVTCTLAAGAVGPYLFAYSVTVDADATGSVSNSVEATGGDDPVCGVCDTLHPLTAPSVSVSKSTDPIGGTEVTPGQTLTYTLTVAVADAATTADVVLVDTLGAGLTVDSLPPSCGAVGQEITCTLASGALPGNYEFVYTATVDSDATVSVGNSVVIDEGGGDPGPACPACEIEHPVTNASVTVNKSADPISGTEVIAGQPIDYILSVEVSDSATTDAVVLTDTLGAGLTLDAGSLPLGCGAVGQVVTCTLAAGSLPGSYTFEYSATVDADATLSVGNSVEATGGDDPACGTCETEHPIVSAALSLAKALINPPNPIVEGSILTYVITATNTGDVELVNVEIVDDMITPDSIVCPNVAVGETCVLEGTYTVTAGDVAAGEVNNTAFANGEDLFGNPVPEVVDSVVTVIGAEEYQPIPVPMVNWFGLLLLILSTLMIGMLAAGRRLQSPMNS